MECLDLYVSYYCLDDGFVEIHFAYIARFMESCSLASLFVSLEDPLFVPTTGLPTETLQQLYLIVNDQTVGRL